MTSSQQIFPFVGPRSDLRTLAHLQYMENMNSVALLVMAVVVNEGEVGSQQPQQSGRKRMWGLVVCHHLRPMFVPFPLRYACEFLIQVFAVHVHKEFELENQIREKNILRTQTLLYDILLRDGDPIGIVSQSPNIMDLLKCDGAALSYQNRIWQLGMTPTATQIHDIAFWLSERHMDSTGLSTDSLHDAGYPGALALGNAVSWMAAARITAKDILFWFRAHAAAEVKWGGAKHDPNEEDDGRRMHPRSSFNAFLQVVKNRSLSWNVYEMDAVHSLQLDQLYMDDIRYPIEHFKTFNEFFIRELKPGAREISCKECDTVAVCADDSRLMAFKSADDSLRFWIKIAREIFLEAVLISAVFVYNFVDF